MARQGSFKPPKTKEKNLKLSALPFKELLKKKSTEESQIIVQTVTNLHKKSCHNLPASPIYCSYPDFKSVLVNDRKIDFTKREITKKVNMAVV